MARVKKIAWVKSVETDFPFDLFITVPDWCKAGDKVIGLVEFSNGYFMVKAPIIRMGNSPVPFGIPHSFDPEYNTFEGSWHGVGRNERTGDPTKWHVESKACYAINEVISRVVLGNREAFGLDTISESGMCSEPFKAAEQPKEKSV